MMNQKSFRLWNGSKLFFFFFFFVFMKFLFTCTWVWWGGGEKTYKIEPPDPITLSKKNQYYKDCKGIKNKFNLKKVKNKTQS